MLFNIRIFIFINYYLFFIKYNKYSKISRQGCVYCIKIINKYIFVVKNSEEYLKLLHSQKKFNISSQIDVKKFHEAINSKTGIGKYIDRYFRPLATPMRHVCPRGAEPDTKYNHRDRPLAKGVWTILLARVSRGPASG